MTKNTAIILIILVFDVCLATVVVRLGILDLFEAAALCAAAFAAGMLLGVLTKGEI